MTARRFAPNVPSRLKDIRSATTSSVSYTHLEYAASQGGSAPDMVRNAALAAYDIESRTIRAGIVVPGQAADECQFRVPIPRS